MFCKNLALLALLLLAGCGNKVKPGEELLSEAKEKYARQEYKAASRLLDQVEENYAWAPYSKDATLLLARSSLEVGKRDWWSSNDLLKCVQRCDLLIAEDPEYSLRKDVHMLKIRAYYNTINFNTQRSDHLAKDAIAAIAEYKKAAKEYNLEKYYEKNKAELSMIEDKCRWYVTARVVAQSLDLNPHSGIHYVDSALDDDDHVKVYPEVYYRKLEHMIKANKKTAEVYEVLAKLHFASRNKQDLIWLEKGIELFEKSGYMANLPKEKKKQIKSFKSLVNLSKTRLSK